MADHGPNGQECKTDECVYDFDVHLLGITRLRKLNRVLAKKLIRTLTAFIGALDAPP